MQQLTRAALCAPAAAVLAGLAGGLGASATYGMRAASSRDKTPPSAPRVQGPRRTSNHAPSFRFRSRDPDNPAGKLHYRCSFDSRHLHACALRYRQRLKTGKHLLRARALDPAGNRGRTTTVVIRITAGTPPPPTLPPAGRITATVAVGHPLGPFAAGESAVWVENRDGTVSRIDPGTNTVVATITTPFVLSGGVGGWIVTGAGSVWISNYGANSVTRIDAATNHVVATIPVGANPTGLAVTPGAVWVANHHGRSLSRIDPAMNAVVATIPVGDQAAPVEGGPQELAAAGGSVWLEALEASGLMLERIDAATNAVMAKIPVGGFCEYGTDGATLWAGCLDERKLYPVDLATSALGTPIALPLPPFSLGVGLGAVWAVDLGPGGLVRFDPAASKPVGQTPFAATGGLALGYGAVWAGRGDQKVLRIEP
jgi:YVTN family beta-propeller protein